MKAAFVALFAALVATVATAGIAFEVPLPSGPSQSNFYTSGSGDMYFTVGTHGRVYGVNLTSKSLVYTRPFDGQGGIFGLLGVGSKGQVIVELEEGGAISFDAQGNFLWESQEFVIPTRPNSYTVIGDSLFYASNSNGVFGVLDLKTGRVPSNTQIQISSGSVTADKAVLSIPGQNYGVNNIIAYSLPAMTKLFEIKNVGAYLAHNSDYVLVSNTSAAGYTDVLVLDATTFATKLTLHSMEGVVSSGFTPVIKGDHALFIVGSETQRLAYYSLTTGYMEWDLYLGQGEGGAPTIINGDALVTISQTKLSTVNLTTGEKGLSINHVPYTSEHTVTAIGGSKIQVANLQGYTQWDLSDGTYIGRNEMSPNAGSSAALPYLYDGLSVTTVGRNVVAQN